MTVTHCDAQGECHMMMVEGLDVSSCKPKNAQESGNHQELGRGKEGSPRARQREHGATDTLILDF